MFSGLRIGEAVGLKWDSVNRKNEEIIVKQSRARIIQEEDNNKSKYTYIQNINPDITHKASHYSHNHHITQLMILPLHP